MENQEFTFAGKTLNGIAMLIFNLLVYVIGIGLRGCLPSMAAPVRNF